MTNTFLVTDDDGTPSALVDADTIHTQGLLTHDLRVGLADAARNAKETLT